MEMHVKVCFIHLYMVHVGIVISVEYKVFYVYTEKLDIWKWPEGK